MQAIDSQPDSLTIVLAYLAQQWRRFRFDGPLAFDLKSLAQATGLSRWRIDVDLETLKTLEGFELTWQDGFYGKPCKARNPAWRDPGVVLQPSEEFRTAIEEAIKAGAPVRFFGREFRI